MNSRNSYAAWLGFLCLLSAVLAPSVTLAQARPGPGPFTQPPRSVRSRAIDQQHVALWLKFDFDQQRIDGQAVHTLSLFQPASTVDLDAAGMKVDGVSLAGALSSQVLKFRHTGQQLTIELGREYPAGEQLRLTIFYTITKPRHGAHFVVPDDDEPNQPRMVWTQSEPEYAR